MKKCAIIFDKINKINVDEYEMFIGVEKGSIWVLKLKNKITHHISDFDTIPSWKVSESTNNITILKEEKNFVDGEEALNFAIKKGFLPEDIDLYIPDNISSRPDHFINMINIVRKYKVTVLNSKMKAFVINENENKKIMNKYKYLSMFITENTIITTIGLKWDMKNREYDIDNSTTMISNEIVGKYAKIFANKKIIIIQSDD